MPLEKVKEARKEEVGEMNKSGIWEVVPKVECWSKTGKEPTSVRWVDTDKGFMGGGGMEVRSRLVAREFNTGERPELYSGTPPINLMKMIVAKVADAQWDGRRWCDKYFGGGVQDDVVMLYTDVSRAYFNAPAQKKQIH